VTSYTNSYSKIEDEIKKMLEMDINFYRKHRNNMLDVMLIIKKLISCIGNKDNLYVIGSSEPIEVNKMIICNCMKFNAEKVINFNQSHKDFESSTNYRRYAITISKVLAEDEEITLETSHSWLLSS
jgi:hypothetical protein